MSGPGRAFDKCPCRTRRPRSLRVAGRGSLLLGAAGRGAWVRDPPRLCQPWLSPSHAEYEFLWSGEQPEDTLRTSGCSRGLGHESGRPSHRIRLGFWFAENAMSGPRAAVALRPPAPGPRPPPSANQALARRNQGRPVGRRSPPETQAKPARPSRASAVQSARDALPALAASPAAGEGARHAAGTRE